MELFTHPLLRKIIRHLLEFILGYYVIRIASLVVDSIGNFDRFLKKSILIVFGSGGHTGEMLKLLSDFDFKKYSKVYLVCASTDNHSRTKFEHWKEEKGIEYKAFHWTIIPRSREVKQSYLTSIFTTSWANLVTFFKLFKFRDADVISNPLPIYSSFKWTWNLHTRLLIFSSLQVPASKPQIEDYIHRKFLQGGAPFTHWETTLQSGNEVYRAVA